MAEKITVNGPKGLQLTFPVGTSKETINQVMTQAYNDMLSEVEVGRDVVGRIGVGQGLMMGFGDEIAAYVKSTGGTPIGAAKAKAKARATGVPMPTYEQALSEERAAIESAREKYPKSSFAAEITGSLAPAVATLGAAAPVTAARTGTLAGNIMRGGGYGFALGGGTGAVSGFGTAEGDVGDRLKGATIGGGLGAVTGGVLGATVPAAGGFARSLFASPETRAQRWALSLLESENLTPEQIIKDYQASQAGGVKPEMLADIYPGGGIARETQRLMTSPGAPRRELTSGLYERAREQGPRITEEFESAFGTGKSLDATLDQLSQQRKATAAPLYEQSYPEKIRNNAIDEILKKTPEEAFSFAKRSAELEGIDFPKIVGADRAGRKAVVFDYTVKDIDQIKRGIDQMIEKETDKGKVSSYGRDLINFKNNLLEAVDKASPTYSQAREAWAGPTSVQNAANLGQTIFQNRPAEILKDISKMSASEKEGFLIGALDAVNQRMAETAQTGSRDVAAKFLTGNAKEQIKAALQATNRTAEESDKLATQLIDNIEREYQMQMTTRLATPSATAPLLAQEQALRGAAGAGAGFVSDLQRGAPAAFGGLLQRGIEKASLGLTQQTLERTNRELAPYFFGRTQPEVKTAMGLLQKAAQEQGRYQPQRNLIPGLMGAPAGVVQRDFGR